MKSPTRKRKSSVKKSRKKISGNRKMRKSWNEKELTRAARKRTRIDASRMRKNVNGKENSASRERQ